MSTLRQTEWPFPVTMTTEDKSVQRPAVPFGSSAELVGVDGTIQGGLRPLTGLRKVHDLEFTADTNHDVTSQVLDFFPVNFRVGDDGYAYGFVYRAQRTSSGTTSDIFVDYYFSDCGSWVKGTKVMDSVPLTSQVDVQVFGRLIYVFASGRSPSLFHVSRTPTGPIVPTNGPESEGDANFTSNDPVLPGDPCVDFSLYVLGKNLTGDAIPGPGKEPEFISNEDAGPLGSLTSTGDENRPARAQIVLTEDGPNQSGLFPDGNTGNPPSLLERPAIRRRYLIGAKTGVPDDTPEAELTSTNPLEFNWGEFVRIDSTSEGLRSIVVNQNDCVVVQICGLVSWRMQSFLATGSAAEAGDFGNITSCTLEGAGTTVCSQVTGSVARDIEEVKELGTAWPPGNAGFGDHWYSSVAGAGDHYGHRFAMTYVASGSAIDTQETFPISPVLEPSRFVGLNLNIQTDFVGMLMVRVFVVANADFNDPVPVATHGQKQSFGDNIAVSPTGAGVAFPVDPGPPPAPDDQGYLTPAGVDESLMLGTFCKPSWLVAQEPTAFHNIILGAANSTNETAYPTTSIDDFTHLGGWKFADATTLGTIQRRFDTTRLWNALQIHEDPNGPNYANIVAGLEKSSFMMTAVKIQPPQDASGEGTNTGEAPIPPGETSTGSSMTRFFTIEPIFPHHNQEGVGTRGTFLQWRARNTDGSALPPEMVFDVYFGEEGSSTLTRVTADLPVTTQAFDVSSLYDTLRLPRGKYFKWRIVARLPVSAGTWPGWFSAIWRFGTVAEFKSRKLDPGDYVFGYFLADTRTGRFSAFSEIAQVKQGEFGTGEGARALFAALEIVYDASKYDQAFIYRSVKTQDAGGTLTAGVLQLDAIVDLIDYHTLAVGDENSGFPTNQILRQSVYYYQLEDKQLIYREPYVDRQFFDEQMPYGGSALMYDGTLFVSNIRGGRKSDALVNRSGDTLRGLGEIRWSSLARSAPELFSPLSRFTPKVQSNEVIRLMQIGPNAYGFSRDRLYHLRKESSNLRVEELHEGFGITTHKAVDLVGPYLYYVTPRGLKTVNAYGELNDVAALDQLMLEPWRSTLNTVSVAFDPLAGVLIILRPDTQARFHDGHAACVWFNTGMVTEIADLAWFTEVRQGVWPRDPVDLTDDLVERAFFLQNNKASTPANLTATAGAVEDFKPSIYVLDYDRSKRISGSSTLNWNGLPSIRMLDFSGDSRFTISNFDRTSGFPEISLVSNGSSPLSPTQGVSGAQLYFLEAPAGYESLIGRRWTIDRVNLVAPDTSGVFRMYNNDFNFDALTDEPILTAALAAGTVRVGISPIKLRWIGHNIGLRYDTQGSEAPREGHDLHQLRHVDGLGCFFTDVSGPPTLETTVIDGKYQAQIYEGASSTPKDTAFTRDNDGLLTRSVQNDETLFWPAFGNDESTGVDMLQGRFGIQGVSLSPGVEIICPDLDYRLLSTLVKGKILPSYRGNQP